MTLGNDEEIFFLESIRRERLEWLYSEQLADEVVDRLVEHCATVQNVGNGEPYKGWLDRVEKKIHARIGWMPQPTQRMSRPPHSISTTKSLRVFARDNYRCVYCGSGENLTVDHIVAWSKGGTNDESNLQTLCKSCNSRKGNR